MEKRLTCDINTSIIVWVDIPEHLIEVFKKYDNYNSWESSSNPDKDACEEIYELINQQICNDLYNLCWDEIEITNEEDINEY